MINYHECEVFLLKYSFAFSLGNFCSKNNSEKTDKLRNTEHKLSYKALA